MTPLNANYQEKKEMAEESSKGAEMTLQNGDSITIKNEAKSEEEDELEEKRPANDLEAVKRILENVNVNVTKQLFGANVPKLSSASCSSGCPSVTSEVPSPAVDEQHELTCKYCGRAFGAFADLQHHEKYFCGQEKKSEGLAAKLEDLVSNHREETNGTSNCNSDSEEEQGCGKEYTMTEDEVSSLMSFCKSSYC